MAKTLIDVDDEALVAAMIYYGSTTKVDTINRALRDAAARHEQAVEAFMKVATEISEALTEVDVRREAWR